MQQKTQGIVLANIKLSKCRTETALQVLKNFSARSGIKIINTSIDNTGLNINATYGPVWGGQEYDIRTKMKAAMNAVNCAGEVTYSSKRLPVKSR